jgi:hypothetical protein
MVVGKAYLHERVLYEYMYHRFYNGKLLLKLVVKEGKVQYNSKTFTVDEINIINGQFPDVEKINFKKDYSYKDGRQAEVKFLTSDFNYHKQPRHVKAFKDFFKNGGCIIVLRHDKPPKELFENYPIDIYELDYDDFNNYVKENHDRLLHKQILGRSGKAHKTWLFSATKKNFYGNKIKHNGKVVTPSMDTGIWCPKNPTDPYEIAEKDKVIFIRFTGPQSTQVAIRKYWEEYNEIHPKWVIKKIWIGEVTMPLMSRDQYCEKMGVDALEPLWPSEIEIKKDGNVKYWPQVFGYKLTKEIDKEIYLAEAYEELDELVYPVFFNLFIQQNAVNITDVQYIKFLEWLTTYEREVISPNIIQDDIIDHPHIEH